MATGAEEIIMAILVNGIEITDAAIAEEIGYHQAAANPTQAAVQELILQTLLQQEAESTGLVVDKDHEASLLDALVHSATSLPVVDDASCRQWFDQHRQHYRTPDLVAASHILFQVTESVNLDLLRAKAEEILTEVRQDPRRFGECAALYSNCPSAAVGGSLGQLQRGETVPEFEKIIFRLPPSEICPYLVETRFGLHIIRVDQRTDGELLPFDAVRQHIATFLSESSLARARHQYLALLVGKAEIQGFEMAGIQIE
jgi:peptidyl-prolyl cis-trans isomerase C